MSVLEIVSALSKSQYLAHNISFVLTSSNHTLITEASRLQHY